MFNDDRDWFFRKRFGMFVHWGIYALEGWHEQHHYRARLSRAEYSRLADRFNPRSFDPGAWLDLAEACGMEYLVFTSKHIDGFCMFDSRHTDYKVTNTPYGRDTLSMLAEACHRRDFPLGIYYSVVDNWQRCYPRADRAHENAREADDMPDLERYVEYVRAQVEEICTRYGPIHAFWWDANHTGHVDTSINARIRELQPAAVINGRGFDPGDFGTPERDYDRGAGEVALFDRPTEACESVGSQSWGYRSDEDYFTPKYLMQRIDLMIVKGANYLLNVGPDGDGAIPEGQQGILRTVGGWYHRAKEALVGVEPALELTSNREVLLTRRGNSLYVHCHKEPRMRGIALPPLTLLPRRATLLNTGEPVRFDLNRLPVLHAQPVKECLRLHDLPVERLSDTVPVIRLDFDTLPGKLGADEKSLDAAAAGNR